MSHPAQDPMCVVSECNRRHYARGYCKRHYSQVLRHGEITTDRKKVPVCPAPRCGRTDMLRGYCRRHARQLKIHGRLTPELDRLMGATACREPGCLEKPRARGRCMKHYGRERRAAAVRERAERKTRAVR